MTENDDRRRSLRRNIQWPVNIAVDDEIVAGETVDISPDGLHIRCDDPVPLNETLAMTIAPPDGNLIEVTAQVVWSDLEGIDTDNPENRVVGMGLCFVEISDRDRRYFEDPASGDLENP